MARSPLQNDPAQNRPAPEKAGWSGLGVLLGAGALGLVAVLGALAIVAALVLIRPYSLPSGSMTPTLLLGDDMLVSKAAYGLGKNSLPLSELVPVQVRGRLWPAEPKRGDLAVFKLPRDNATDYIKRVVGLPGDRIQIVGGVLTINGTPVERRRIADFETAGYDGRPAAVPHYVETLPDGTSYEVVEIAGDAGFWDNTEVYAVPPGHVFTLGDNRDNSTDSRDLESVGYVPFENLVGRPLLVYFSVAEGTGAIRTERLFKTIH